MSRVSVQRLVKGDIIIERVGGKNRMTPIRKVEFNACSNWGVHVNSNACYDFNAVVDIVEGEGTLGDMEKEMSALGDLEEDFPTDEDLRQAGERSIEAWADFLVKQ